MVTYVKNQYTDKHHLEEKYLIYYLQLIERTINQIIYHVLHGEEMLDFAKICQLEQK